MGIKGGMVMLKVWSLWGLVLCLGAFAENAKYPNVDSLSYWNRAMETKDAILILNKELIDTKGYLITRKYDLEKQKKLHEKNATTTMDLRQAQWLVEDLELKISEISEMMLEAELFEQLYMLRYQWAKEEKVETVAAIAAIYTEQWKRRALINEIRVARARAELSFRQWVFEITEKLHAKGAETEVQLIHARDLRDEVIGRLNVMQARVELARQAEKESMATERQVR